MARPDKTIKLMRDLGAGLNQARTACKISQQQLAKRLGYTGGQIISNIERGITTPPMHNLSKYCKLINASSEAVKMTLAEIYVSRFK